MRPGFETLCHPKDPLIQRCLTIIHVMCTENDQTCTAHLENETRVLVSTDELGVSRLRPLARGLWGWMGSSMLILLVTHS